MSAAASRPVDLESLSAEQFRHFLTQFDHVCCDCDGVLWSGVVPLEGAGAAVNRLAAGKSLHFVSNNSTSTPQHYEKLFQLAGIENGYERLITPAWALCRHLRATAPAGAPLYCVASDQTVAMLTEAGFHCITGPSQAVADPSEVARLSAAPAGVCAVVMDSDYAVNIHKLHRAVSALADPRVSFLGGAPDLLVPLAPGRTIMGAGVFMELVARVSGREPLVLAKPHPRYGHVMMERAGITRAHKVLFVGDSLKQDIKFARTMGFQSLLVLTGVTTREELTRVLASETASAAGGGGASETEMHSTPDYYVSSLGALRDKLESR